METAENPLGASFESEAVAVPQPEPEPEPAADAGERLDEDTVSDLKWAFLATDLDHSGTLEPHELHTLLVVLGGNKPVEMHALMKIMEEAKADFEAYREANGLKDYLPDEYQYLGEDDDDGDSGDDLGFDASFEIEEGGPPANKKAKAKRAMEQKSGRKVPEGGIYMKKGKQTGADPALNRFYLRDPMKMTKKVAQKATSAALDVAKQTADVSMAAARQAQKTAKQAADATTDIAKKTADATMDVANKAADATKDVAGKALDATLDIAGDTVRKNVEAGIAAAGDAVDAVADLAGDAVDGALEITHIGLKEKEEAEDAMHFAEFVHMMKTGKLDSLFPGKDWRAGAKQIHQYRKAFDAADVDGDNTLEEGEFELVMETLHMGHDLSQAEVRHAWQVLKTAREEGNRENHLTFMEFIVGVQKIRDDEVLGGRIDLTKPCPWEMLSLLIDTPVSEMESAALYDELSMLERLGVNMVQGMSVPMKTAQIKAVLKEAVEGRLHFLSEDKVRRMDTVWQHCIIHAMMISFISTGITSPLENLAVYLTRSDGFMDVDCLCYTRGCATNPGSLGIAALELEPGDATLPGSSPFADECSYLFGEAQVQDSCARVDLFGNASCTAIRDGGLARNVACPCDVSEPFNMVTDCDAACLRDCGFVPAWGPSPWATDPSQIEWWNTVWNATGSSGYAGPVDSCWSNTTGMFWFWFIVVMAIIVCATGEVIALMYYGVMHSIRVSWALGYRLVPLNEDRAFLADSLVRGAFELGNPENPLFGVDPMAETDQTNKARLILMGFSWKGKIVVTASLLKFLVGTMVPWQWAVWIKPWMCMPADMFWNAMTAHIVVKQAQIRGIGVATVHEVFNEVMAYSNVPRESMRDIFKLQIVRAVGVAIVKHGNMYPTMEILLRHAVQWLGMKSSPAVQRPGVLDNEDLFIQDLAELEDDELVAVLCVLVLTMSMDGGLNDNEHEMLNRIFNTVPDKIGEYREERLRWTCCQYRNFVPLSAQMLRASFMVHQYKVEIPTGWGGFRHREMMHWLTDVLTL